MNLLRIGVPNPDELLATGALGAGAVVHVESGTSPAGPWTNITPSTLPLTTLVYEYLFADQSGTDATWYHWRVQNAAATVFGDWTVFQPQADGYGNLGEVKLRLSRDDTWTGMDALLTSYNRDVSAFIEQRTERVFYQSPMSGTVQQLFDGFDITDGGHVTANGKCLLVPRGMVSLTTVEVATYTGAAYNTIPSSDWFLRPVGMELSPGWPYTELWITNIPSSSDTTPSFYPGFATIRLTGVFNWPAIPLDLVDLANTLIVSRYRSRGAGGGDSYTTGDDGARTYERFLSATDRATLASYRLKMPRII